MSFPTIEFAAFFVVVFIVSWALMPHPRAWRPFILVASYFFYGWVDWRWVLLLIASSVVNTFAAQVIARSPSQVDAQARAGPRRSRSTSALLGTFKYFGFFVDEIHALDGIGLGSPLPIVQIVLPIGISFFTFQAISYVVDVYRGETRAASLRDVAILQGFFPHLVAGPIVRANELLPQLRTPARPAGACWPGPGLFLIAGGLIKKTVVADELARRVVDPVYNDPAAHSGGEILLAFYAFAAQIYCDFSGYTDMAIGLALLLGFQLPQNFNRPYMALTLQEFWRRWHITLSRWLRDYLYIPLGGNREGRAQDLPQPDDHDAARRALARRVVDVPDLGRHPRQRALASSAGLRERFGASACRSGLRWFVTFNVVCIAWVFFRAPNLATAFDILGGIGLSRPVAAGHASLWCSWWSAAIAVQAPAAGLVARAEAWVVPGRWPPRGSRSARSSWPRTRPSASRAWPPSSTSSSDPWTRSQTGDLTMPAGRVLGVLLIALVIAAAVQLGGDRPRGRGHAAGHHARHRALGRPPARRRGRARRPSPSARGPRPRLRAGGQDGVGHRARGGLRGDPAAGGREWRRPLKFRQPTPGNPIEVLVTGDSEAEFLGQRLTDQAQARPARGGDRGPERDRADQSRLLQLGDQRAAGGGRRATPMRS